MPTYNSSTNLALGAVPLLDDPVLYSTLIDIHNALELLLTSSDVTFTISEELILQLALLVDANSVVILALGGRVTDVEQDVALLSSRVTDVEDDIVLLTSVVSDQGDVITTQGATILAQGLLIDDLSAALIALDARVVALEAFHP